MPYHLCNGLPIIQVSIVSEPSGESHWSIFKGEEEITSVGIPFIS
jgi:hypothetical protein